VLSVLDTLTDFSFRIASVAAISIAMAEFDDLLLNGKKSTTPGKEYDRTAYNNYASNPKAAFQKLYMYSFNLVKPEYVSRFSWTSK